MATAPLQLGRYEALGLIAQGGMAKVYLGRARGVGGFQRKVAIKVMHPHIAAEPQFVNMFLDEARLAAIIHHPNVVSTLDIHDSPEQGLSLVMEYVQGASLDRIIEVHRHATGRPLPLAASLRILLDALAGLHAAHDLTDEEGSPLAVVHRDVSPQNILVGTDGIARITDFGVARAEARISSTREGMVKGKLVYMAIEQLKALPVDRRTDVYAAGVVLWELLAGRQLFVGDSQAALVHAVLMGPEAMPSDLNAEVPAEIDVVCMRALLPDPAERYPSAAALAEALRQGAAAAGLAPASSAEVGALARAAHIPPKPLDDGASGLELRTGHSGVSTQRTPGSPGFSGPDTGTVKMGSDELAPSFDPAPQQTLTRPLAASGAVAAISEQTEALATPVPMPVPHAPVSTTTSGSIAAIAAHRRPSSAPVIVAAVSLVAFVVAGLAFLMSSPSDSASSSPPPAAAGSAKPPPEPAIATEPATEVADPPEPKPSPTPAETAASAAPPRPAPVPRPRRPAPAPVPKRPDVGFDPLRP